MFKLCFNSTTLRNMDIFQALSIIRQYEYEGVELTINDEHLHPLKHVHSRYIEIKKFCEDHAIDIVCIAAGGPNVLGDEPYEPSLINKNPSSREKRLDFIKRSLELAEALDAPVLNINSGKLGPDVTPQEAYEYFYVGIQHLLGLVGSAILAIEPEPDFFIGTTEEAIGVINEINSDKFRLNLDIGHVFCSEHDCYNKIKRGLPFTRHIHIEDIKNGVHHHEIPGEGDIDFKRVVGIIKQSGYEHYVSVELHHHDFAWQRALKESRDHLMEFI